ncbi:hypothetical protein [uncultured Demequina sp.]|uniref:hypothetical protein n=1 Tax=uncultured Demequina sp. TaxID=693499 RepID=UPI0025FAD62D|nr:hypothetical protein [uncultured Demequina sp.]
MLRLNRRAAAGAVAGSALLLAGCAVPGQPGQAGTAAEVDGTVITNQQVSDLYDVWLEDIGSPANRRQVITLEMMREPLAARADEIEFEHVRAQARAQAEGFLSLQGSTAEPTEEMVDAFEGALLLAAFTVLPEDTSVIESVAHEVEASAVTSGRTGEFSADAFMQSLTVTAEKAVAAAQQGVAAWFLEYNDVVGLVEPDSPWIASE